MVADICNIWIQMHPEMALKVLKISLDHTPKHFLILQNGWGWTTKRSRNFRWIHSSQATRIHDLQGEAATMAAVFSDPRIGCWRMVVPSYPKLSHVIQGLPFRPWNMALEVISHLWSNWKLLNKNSVLILGSERGFPASHIWLPLRVSQQPCDKTMTRPQFLLVFTSPMAKWYNWSWFFLGSSRV